MSEIFITVLNMSLTSSYVAAGVILVRLLLRRAPRVFSYMLWAVVLFRMICPFSFESVISVLPKKNEPISPEIIRNQEPAPENEPFRTYIPVPDGSPETSAEKTAVNPIEILIAAGTYLWLSGILTMICYAVISYIKVKRRIYAATLVRGNIFEAQHIETPFVMGFVNTKIYIPAGLGATELDCVVKHEQTHIHRKDYLIKPLAYVALALHWFNPLMWLGFILMSKDMEMSCDESVMKRSGDDIRTGYSQSLLSLSVKRGGLPNPLAFGESSVKSRVKNVLHYRRPSFWISIAAVAAVIFTTAALASNQINADLYAGVERYFEKANCKVNLELPEALTGQDYITGSGELFYEFYMHEKEDYRSSISPIANSDAIVVGVIELVSFDNIPEEQINYYKEDPEKNFRALYYQLPMGSMNFWGQDYKVVYESEDRREGTATNLVYYRSDFIDQYGISFDFSHFKEETVEGDPRINYSNKGVLGYNLDLNAFVKIEFYYDAVTEEELRHIAETLRISGAYRAVSDTDDEPPSDNESSAPATAEAQPLLPDGYKFRAVQ